jgi:aldehyde:ferredoxin oxidoreductase
MADAIEAIAYRRDSVGTLLGDTADGTAKAILERLGDGRRDDVDWCMVMAYGGLGYAGIQPKAFPAMNACYATSNRGRGDHTYGWTVQAEEAGVVTTPEEIGPFVASSQWGKAVIDSLGICDFFAFDVTSDIFRDLLYAITGNRYTADGLTACGRRTVNLERMLNAVQGRSRAYDEFTPP